MADEPQIAEPKIIVNGERVSISAYLASLSIEELRIRHAEAKARAEDIDKQIRQDLLIDRRGEQWRHKARRALRAARVEASYIGRTLQRVEKEQRFAAYFSQEPDARLIALERTREIVKLMIERDERFRAYQRTEAELFVRAAINKLGKEMVREIFRDAEALDPDNPCWKPAQAKTSAERDAMRRAKKLWLLAEAGALTGEEED